MSLNSILRNAIAAGVFFVGMAAIDYLYIHQNSLNVDAIALASITIVFLIALPIGFWWVNRRAFEGRASARLLRMFVALTLAGLFLVLSYVPFMWVHLAMGGSH